MSKHEQPRNMLAFDGDGNRLHATWSKSMKSLIVTVGPPDPSGREWRQIVLDQDQAAQLRDFIAETHPGSRKPADLGQRSGMTPDRRGER